MVENISSYIDYTLLKTDATSEMYGALCEEAKKHNFYSVCVPPYMVRECRRLLEGSGVKIATVIAFPLGYASAAAKVFETENAVSEGADEIDAVINVSALKSGRFDYVLNELKEIRKAAGKCVLKIIIETCYLGKEEIVKAAALVAESGADYVKTSTGFGPYGARIEDVELIRQTVPAGVGIKASGGIKTYGQAKAFIKAGASRIGTSSALCKTEGV
jgi:deoxyribose-phosphate aldolase